jgi:hypothetical protein
MEQQDNMDPGTNSLTVVSRVKLPALRNSGVRGLRPFKHRQYERLFRMLGSPGQKRGSAVHRIYMTVDGQATRYLEPPPIVLQAVQACSTPKAQYTVENYLSGLVGYVSRWMDPATKTERVQFKIRGLSKLLIDNQQKLDKLGLGHALKIFVEDPLRAATEQPRYLAVLSRHPYDIAGMSTGRSWTSCTNLSSGVMKKHIPNYIKYGFLVLYMLDTVEEMQLTKLLRHHNKLARAHKKAERQRIQLLRQQHRKAISDGENPPPLDPRQLVITELPNYRLPLGNLAGSRIKNVDSYDALARPLSRILLKTYWSSASNVGYRDQLPSEDSPLVIRAGRIYGRADARLESLAQRITKVINRSAPDDLYKAVPNLYYDGDVSEIAWVKDRTKLVPQNFEYLIKNQLTSENQLNYMIDQLLPQQMETTDEQITEHTLTSISALSMSELFGLKLSQFTRQRVSRYYTHLYTASKRLQGSWAARKKLDPDGMENVASPVDCFKNINRMVLGQVHKVYPPIALQILQTAVIHLGYKDAPLLPNRLQALEILDPLLVSFIEKEIKRQKKELADNDDENGEGSEALDERLRELIEHTQDQKTIERFLTDYLPYVTAKGPKDNSYSFGQRIVPWTCLPTVLQWYKDREPDAVRYVDQCLRTLAGLTDIADSLRLPVEDGRTNRLLVKYLTFYGQLSRIVEPSTVFTVPLDQEELKESYKLLHVFSPLTQGPRLASNDPQTYGSLYREADRILGQSNLVSHDIVRTLDFRFPFIKEYLVEVLIRHAKKLEPTGYTRKTVLNSAISYPQVLATTASRFLATDLPLDQTLPDNLYRMTYPFSEQVRQHIYQTPVIRTLISGLSDTVLQSHGQIFQSLAPETQRRLLTPELLASFSISGLLDLETAVQTFERWTTVEKLDHLLYTFAELLSTAVKGYSIAGDGGGKESGSESEDSRSAYRSLAYRLLNHFNQLTDGVPTSIYTGNPLRITVSPDLIPRLSHLKWFTGLLKKTPAQTQVSPSKAGDSELSAEQLAALLPVLVRNQASGTDRDAAVTLLTRRFLDRSISISQLVDYLTPVFNADAQSIAGLSDYSEFQPLIVLLTLAKAPDRISSFLRFSGGSSWYNNREQIEQYIEPLFDPTTAAELGISRDHIHLMVQRLLYLLEERRISAHQYLTLLAEHLYTQEYITDAQYLLILRYRGVYSIKNNVIGKPLIIQRAYLIGLLSTGPHTFGPIAGNWTLEEYELFLSIAIDVWTTGQLSSTFDQNIWKQLRRQADSRIVDYKSVWASDGWVETVIGHMVTNKRLGVKTGSHGLIDPGTLGPQARRLLPVLKTRHLVLFDLSTYVPSKNQYPGVLAIKRYPGMISQHVFERIRYQSTPGTYAMLQLICKTIPNSVPDGAVLLYRMLVKYGSNQHPTLDLNAFLEHQPPSVWRACLVYLASNLHAKEISAKSGGLGKSGGLIQTNLEGLPLQVTKDWLAELGPFTVYRNTGYDPELRAAGYALGSLRRELLKIVPLGSKPLSGSRQSDLLTGQQRNESEAERDAVISAISLPPAYQKENPGTMAFIEELMAFQQVDDELMYKLTQSLAQKYGWRTYAE